MDEIYTGSEQWKVEGAGYCEHCRRQPYCTENFRKGGCRVRRKRLEKEGIKKKIEMALSMGLTPEQIGVTPEMIKEYDVEMPEMPEIPEATSGYANIQPVEEDVTEE